jgi:thiol-disulfide isomerase/thioredoxin
MKKILAALMALLLMCSFAFADGLQFVTTDMEGNVVTQEIFAGHDLTMVNVWATWCGYCIEEMPEFAALKNRLAEHNGNLITICDDAAVEPELTALILEATGANFTTLLATVDMYHGILSSVYAFPTTFFVDSEGNMVGEPVVGVPSLEEAGEAYYQIFMDRLASL